jgi:hypothetical protein
MIVALSGYADAGHLAEQVRETLLGGLPSEVLASAGPAPARRAP